MDSKYAALSGKAKPLHINGFAMKRKFKASPTTNGGGGGGGGEHNGRTKMMRMNGSTPKQNKSQNGVNGGAAKTPNGNQTPQKGAGQSADKLETERKCLPVYKCRKFLIQELRKQNTLLLMGETGSGKTTQIPQFLYTSGFAKQGIIGVTQPRRVAAITIAKRVALEQGSQLGDLVGYTVRFEDCTSPKTRIKFLTDGTLLREALSDRLLKRYSVIMLDEAHERTVNTDVLLGIVKEAQKQRKAKDLPALKVIVTSATMDIDNFSKYLGVRGIYLEGRMHPVKAMHVKELQSDATHAALVTLFDIHRTLPVDHDVLVFLTGQEEIEAMAQQIRQIAKFLDHGAAAVRVYPLYAQLPQNRQMDCFMGTPSNTRKIILATNIAETSLTIPGIRCVIDCGYVKKRSYIPSCGLDVLRVNRISKAEAWQRTGRAGRDAPGICYRTFTQKEMAELQEMPKPEILRTNLATTALQLLALGIDCLTFDFLDKPAPEAVQEAYKKLQLLGAIKKLSPDTAPQLTPEGRKMSQFPLDPQYSKLILAAPQFGCMEEILSLVAVLSGDNVFITNSEKREMATLAHAKFHSKHGDHLTLLNVFTAFEKTSKTKLWCHDNFLNTRNLMYAREVRKQLAEIAERLGLQTNSCGENLDAVRKCLLVGLHQNIAELQRDKAYCTVFGRQRAKIHPSSVFHAAYKPAYVLFSEMVLTENNFLKTVTEIDPQWIAEVVPNFPYLSRIRTQLS